jgi:hypothetical protein
MHASIVNLGYHNGFSAGVSVDSPHSVHVGMELSARRHLSPRGPESRCRPDSKHNRAACVGATLVCLVARPDQVGFGAAWPGITMIGLCGKGAGQFIPMSMRLAAYGIYMHELSFWWVRALWRTKWTPGTSGQKGRPAWRRDHTQGGAVFA